MYLGKAHSDKFEAEKDATYTRLTDEFIHSFCDAEYHIDWHRIVETVSQTNLPKATRKSAPRSAQVEEPEKEKR